MERQNRKGARRKLAVPRLVNEKQLLAILKSRKGDECIARLAETLRQAWCRIEELEGVPVERNDQEERDWQTCERVLVVSEVDGSVEIFAESWVAVKHVHVEAWEDRDEVLEQLSEEWKRLDWPAKSRLIIVPEIRPGEDWSRVLERYHRMTIYDRAREVLEARK